MSIATKLDRLEKDAHWKEAFSLAYAERHQSTAMCRCIFYGWYIPLEWGWLITKPEPTQEEVDLAKVNMQSAFIEVKNSDDPTVLREIGYGMGIVDYEFPDFDNPHALDHRDYLVKALTIKPDDYITQLMYDNSFPIGHKSKYKTLDSQKWRELVYSTYPGNGEYATYFQSVLTAKSQN